AVEEVLQQEIEIVGRPQLCNPMLAQRPASRLLLALEFLLLCGNQGDGFAKVWIETHVKGYFNSIDWELVLKPVRHHTNCARGLLCLERWVKAPVQMEDASVARLEGSPCLGGCFLEFCGELGGELGSPHLCNIRFPPSPKDVKGSDGFHTLRIIGVQVI